MADLSCATVIVGRQPLPSKFRRCRRSCRRAGAAASAPEITARAASSGSPFGETHAQLVFLGAKIVPSAPVIVTIQTFKFLPTLTLQPSGGFSDKVRQLSRNALRLTLRGRGARAGCDAFSLLLSSSLLAQLSHLLPRLCRTRAAATSCAPSCGSPQEARREAPAPAAVEQSRLGLGRERCGVGTAEMRSALVCMHAACRRDGDGGSHSDGGE